MSKAKNYTHQHFVDHFLSLDNNRKITNLNEILDLPLNALKDLSIEDVEDLKKNNLNTIRDIGQLSLEESNLQKTQVRFSPAKFDRILIACKLVFLANQKKTSASKKNTTKIIFIGLDNAGKTSLINMLAGKKVSESINLGPTTMVNHINISSQDLDIMAWDFGGQRAYREAYFQNPEEYFSDIDLVIFVMDSLDSQRYEEALKYFSQFLETLAYLGESPYILVLLHKVDPDLQADPEFQINLEYLTGRVREILRQVKSGREIVTSSIYNSYYGQPSIVSGLKESFKTQKLGEENILILNVVMKMTDLLVQIGNRISNLQEQMQNQISGLDSRIREIPGMLKPLLTNSPADSKNMSKNNKSGHTLDASINPYQEDLVKLGTKDSIPPNNTPQQKASPLGKVFSPPLGWPANVPYLPAPGWSSGEDLVPESSISSQDKENNKNKPQSNAGTDVKKDPLRGEIISELQEIFRKRGIVRQ